MVLFCKMNFIVHLNFVGIDGLGQLEGEVTIFKNNIAKYVYHCTHVLRYLMEAI